MSASSSDARSASTSMLEIPTIVMSSPCVQRRALPNGTSNGFFGHIGVGEIKQPMLDEDHRIVVANGVDEAALGVIGIGRRHHFQSRHVHEHGVQALRVLRALPPGLADHAAHDQRHLDLAVIHVAALGRDVDELVHAQHEEIHADMDMDRPHAGHGRADGDAGHGIFRQRRAEHAFRAEDIDQAARRALDRLVIVDIETEDKHARVALHLLRHRLAERIDIGQETLVTLPAKTLVYSALVSGNGLVSANATASAISASTSVVDRGSPRSAAISVPILIELIALQPRLALGGRAIAGVEILVRTDVLQPAIGAAFDEGGPLAAAQRRDRGIGFRAQFQHIAVFDAARRNSVGLDTFAQALRRPAPRHRRVNGVEIVLADEQDRQFVQSREVQALGEHALFGRAIAEKGHDHAIASRALERQRKADRERDRGSDHGAGAQNAMWHIDEMHRAALAVGSRRSPCRRARRTGRATMRPWPDRRRVRDRSAKPRRAVRSTSQTPTATASWPIDR